MIIPIGNDDDKVRRIPWATFTIIVLCILAHLAVSGKTERAINSYSMKMSQFRKYYMDHSYLEIDPELKKQLFPSKPQAAIFEGMMGANNPEEPEDEDILEEEQDTLDRLFREAEMAKREVPYFNYGYIPAEKNFGGLLSYMFIHLDWWHLLSNLVLLYLCAPFIEEAWGKPVFTVFYIFVGVVSALLFGFRYSDSMVPLIGASGAIAGVLGAFLVRYWKTRIKFFYWVGFLFVGTFHAPGWLMLPLWLGFEYLFASILDSMSLGGSGVAHWAHIWGLVFGGLIALAFKYIRFEEKFIKPKMDALISSEEKLEVLLKEAGNLIENGKKEEAYAKFLEAARINPGQHEIVENLWHLGLELGKKAEASRYFVRLIETEIRQSQLEAAYYHYKQLKTTEPELAKRLNVQLKIVLMEYVSDNGEYEEVKELYDELVKSFDIQSPPGTLMQFADVSIKLDSKYNRALATGIVQLAVSHPNIPQMRKEDLQKRLSEIPKQKKEKEALQSDMIKIDTGLKDTAFAGPAHTWQADTPQKPKQPPQATINKKVEPVKENDAIDPGFDMDYSNMPTFGEESQPKKENNTADMGYEMDYSNMPTFGEEEEPEEEPIKDSSDLAFELGVESIAPAAAPSMELQVEMDAPPATPTPAPAAPESSYEIGDGLELELDSYSPQAEATPEPPVPPPSHAGGGLELELDYANQAPAKPRQPAQPPQSPHAPQGHMELDGGLELQLDFSGP
ncbi:MAG: rhomboid family intramembrane serine protease, partial [bacterium]|nr:rhomboid family intramembrane serine protease [bacterium]